MQFMRIRLLHTIFFCFISLGALAQPGVSSVEIISGKKYYKHEVKKGQTLYGISKMYDVSQEDILNSNPESKDGIKVGNELLIPVKGEVNIPSNVSVENKPKPGTYIEHTVEKGETFYGITRKYNVSQAEIITFNGFAADYVLQPGDVIMIPSEAKQKEVIKNTETPVEENKDTKAIKHTVQKGETMYAISKKYKVTQEEIMAANGGLAQGLKVGEVINIPAREGVVAKEPTLQIIKNSESSKEKYKIAILLPFMHERNRLEQAKCPSYADCPLYGVTKNALEMYMGIELALDSMRKKGLNLEVFVYDTRNDSLTVANLLAKDELKTADLIIGPVFPDRINQVARFAKANQIRMVCPVPAPNKIIFNNPYVTKAMSSTPTQVEQMAQFVAKTYATENIILMRNVTGNDVQLYKSIKNTLNTELKNQPRRFRDTVYTATTGSNLADLKPKLIQDKLNIIIVPSENLSYVSNFLTRLNGVYNSGNYFKYQYKVFGLEEWNKFASLDYAYLSKFKVNLVSSFHADYASDNTLDMIRQYRGKFNTDPTYYSLVGYDIALYHLRGLMLNGTDFDTYYANSKWEGLSLGFDLKKPEQGSGYENYRVRIVENDNHKPVRQNP
jgi:LysM repeat protein/ABC-type branched-subunit amino acid transport system substrate-binding protein